MVRPREGSWDAGPLGQSNDQEARCASGRIAVGHRPLLSPGLHCSQRFVAGGGQEGAPRSVGEAKVADEVNIRLFSAGTAGKALEVLMTRG
ncbi:hypothetical protein [Haloactinospora alba]|uniref:hypothetical protein n=1 Tax=Haloactinospora alba TaxID=405555 RepID=UPI0011541512|nr:hypothetical protein [Haloactinospora alba]